MPEQENQRQLLVSVQDARARDARAGHLAWGRLTHERYVVVADPPEAWLADDVNPEALLWTTSSPTQAVEPGTVERVKIARLQRHGLRGRPERQFTGIRLTHPVTSVKTPLLLDALLREPIRNEAELGAVLDILSEQPLEGPDGADELLSRVVEAEGLARRSLLDDRTAEDPWPEKAFICWILGLDGCR